MMLVKIDRQRRIDQFIDCFGGPRTSGSGGASPREPHAGDTAQGWTIGPGALRSPVDAA
jgi:hypothetical protein